MARADKSARLGAHFHSTTMNAEIENGELKVWKRSRKIGRDFEHNLREMSLKLFSIASYLPEAKIRSFV